MHASGINGLFCTCLKDLQWLVHLPVFHSYQAQLLVDNNTDFFAFAAWTDGDWGKMPILPSQEWVDKHTPPLGQTHTPLCLLPICRFAAGVCVVNATVQHAASTS